MMAKVTARLARAPELTRLPLEPRRDWTAELQALRTTLQPGQSRVLAYRPVEDAIKHWMSQAIRNLIGTAKRELLIGNAYIIPDEELIDMLRGLTARGVTVRILTNSLATTDVPAVNSHYKQWRRPLIEAGVEWHELRPDAALKATAADTPPTSSSSMGLHAKAIVVDRTRVFVGSMNLDPRSTDINSEMGVLVESPELAGIAAAALDDAMKPANSWRVEIDRDGDLRWVAGAQVLRFQPARSVWERIEDLIYVIFPRQFTSDARGATCAGLR